MKNAALWLLGIVVVILLIMQYRGSNTGSTISEPNQKTIDSLETTKPAFDAHVDTTLRAMIHDTVEIVRHAKGSADAERRATVAGQRADSLASMNTVWQEAYEARTEQVAELKISLTQKDSAWKDERSARLRISGLYGADTLRRVALEKLNAGLRSDLAKAERPCRIIGPIPCPNRRTSFVGGALLGRFSATGVPK